MSETDSPDETSWAALIGAQRLSVLFILCLCVWLHASDSTLVATLNPDIVKRFNGAALVGWSVTLYEIGSIVAGITCGLASARWGLRVPMALGAALFGLGCLMSGSATDMLSYLAGRLVQGAGGGAVVALAFVAIATLYPERVMPKATALVALVWGASAFIGPLVGGIFAHFDLWRGAFLVYAAQALGSVVAIYVLMPAKPRADSKSEGRLPILRLVVLSGGITLIGLAGSTVNLALSAPWLVLGMAALVGFVILDGRSGADRLLPPRPFSLGNPVGAANVMIATFGACTISFTIYGPIVLRAVHGLSALATGYLIALSSISWTLAAVLVAGLHPRHDGRAIRAGAFCLTLSIIGFAIAMPAGPLWLITLCALLEGAGFGLAWTFIARRATLAAASDDVERVAGALPTIHRGGYALGAALAGLIANLAGFPAGVDIESARSVAFWVFASMIPATLLGFVAAWQLTADQVPKRSRT